MEEHLEQAEQRVRDLRAQADDPNVGQRRHKARERAAREKAERLQAAIQHNEELAAAREARKKGDGPKTRTSSTDPEARKMQMSDGGFRPAYNVQFATTTDTKIIVGIDVINQGNDAGQMQPMIAQIQERLDQVPDHHLTDGGFSTKKDIEATAQMGTTVYTPVKEEAQQKAKGQDPFAEEERETAGGPMAAADGHGRGRAALQTAGRDGRVGQCLYGNRGMQQFIVRGLAKVKAVVLWYVLAHNLLRAEALRAQKRARGEIPCA